MFSQIAMSQLVEISLKGEHVGPCLRIYIYIYIWVVCSLYVFSYFQKKIQNIGIFCGGVTLKFSYKK